MKKNIIFSLVLGLPLLAMAHMGPVNFDSGDVPLMMRYVEDRVLGEELHEEMENLMLKMMLGQLTQSEADQLSDLMVQYPGPHGMMMYRLGASNWQQAGWGMMPWTVMGGFGLWNLWGWVSGLGMLVWLSVGVLLVVLLWKQINK
jgi:hypothetical protein